jgi:hypothetical protein
MVVKTKFEKLLKQVTECDIVSNNKMTSFDVKRRHAFIKKRLKEAGL